MGLLDFFVDWVDGSSERHGQEMMEQMMRDQEMIQQQQFMDEQMRQMQEASEQTTEQTMQDLDRIGQETEDSLHHIEEDLMHQETGMWDDGGSSGFDVFGSSDDGWGSFF